MVMVQLLRKLFDAFTNCLHINQALVRALPFLSNLVTVVLVLVGTYWLLQLWDISVAPLLASAEIVTAAVALGSKDTLANFFGGVSIVVGRPYAQGDYILKNGELPHYRLRVAVGVWAYDSDLDQVEAALLKALRGIPETMPRPKPRTRLSRFGDSALKYELLAWVERPTEPQPGATPDQLINRHIYNILKQQGVDSCFVLIGK
ncbi:hypothetical protein DFAR_2730005 [Desulfarculales bacterium]